MELKRSKSSIYTTLVTPAGEVTGYSRIFEPSTKYNKAGEYILSIFLSKEDGERVLEVIKKVQKEQIANFRKNEQIAPITSIVPFVVMNEEGEEVREPEGRYVLKARAKANIKDSKITNKIGVFDAKGKPVKSASLGHGSIVKLKLDVSGYTIAGKVGVSIKLLAVQILKLVEFTNTLHSFAGFEEEEGFEYDETLTVSKETEPDDEEAF